MLTVKIMGISVDEYKRELKEKSFEFQKKRDVIEQSIKIIEDFSIAKRIHDGKKLVWKLDVSEWEKNFNNAYNNLHKRFTENLHRLRVSSAYQCSKKCCPSIYTIEWSEKMNRKCPNGHMLVFISRQEKDAIIEKFQYDINILEITKKPSEIVNTIQNQFMRPNVQKEIELPTYSLSYIQKHLHCDYMNQFQNNIILSHIWRN
jgi:tRNA A37 threonylcarbamoyladenosine biosynthesis protein TsaE